MNDYIINVPPYLRKMNSLPDDPANSVAYGLETESCNIFMMTYPIGNQNAMNKLLLMVSIMHYPIVKD